MSSKSNRTGLAVLLCLAALGANHAARASIEAGKALAIEACSACHQVIPTQKKPAPVASPDEGVPVQAPTFAAIAALCLPADQLRLKIASPHYPMREQMFSGMDLEFFGCLHRLSERE